MRIFIPIVITIAIIAGAGIEVNNSLYEASVVLSDNIELVRKDIADGNWELARQNTAGLEAKWQQKTGWWPVILDHQEMEEIEFSLAKTKEFVAGENSVLALSQLAEMKLMIEHLPAKERINLKNIL